MKIFLSRGGFQLSGQLGLAASLIQFKCTKYFRGNLRLVFNINLVFHISEDGSEMELKHCAWTGQERHVTFIFLRLHNVKLMCIVHVQKFSLVFLENMLL